jgi:hypothetical protein
MFVAALFIIANLGKHRGCSTTDELSKKMWYILYIIKFYSAIKKNEILSFADKWMQLENIILSEVTQVQKAQSCMVFLICGI